VHAVLLGGCVPLFLGALLSDIAYARSYDVQWLNFASWLIAGALVFCGFALLWAVVEVLRRDRRGRRRLGYALMLLVTFVVGFVNALVHAKDAWATMPEGLILSALVAIFILAATWLGFAGTRTAVTA
jgi:uncharacterized membrane protein